MMNMTRFTRLKQRYDVKQMFLDYAYDLKEFISLLENGKYHENNQRYVIRTI